VRSDRLAAERAKRKKPDEKIYEVTLDNADKPELQLVKMDVTPTPSPASAADEKSGPADSEKKAAPTGAQNDAGDGKPGGSTPPTTASAAPAATPAPTPDDDDSDEDLFADKRPAYDPIRTETLNILRDLVELSKTPKTASVTKP
jgi:hypothetical protein